MKDLLEQYVRHVVRLLESKQELGDSIDTQIDSYLSNFFQQSSEVTESKFKLRALLEEKDDEEAEESDEPVQPATPPKQGLNTIDVAEYAQNVARLIDNVESMLEFRSTIAQRAINFLSKTHSDDVIVALKDALREQHSIEPGKTKQETEDDNFVPPFGERSGPDVG